MVKNAEKYSDLWAQAWNCGVSLSPKDRRLLVTMLAVCALDLTI